MDPNELIREIFESDLTTQELYCKMSDMFDWLLSGGFRPVINYPKRTIKVNWGSVGYAIRTVNPHSTNLGWEFVRYEFGERCRSFKLERKNERIG